jgi:hypothetical protein
MAHDQDRRDCYGPIADHVTDQIDNLETVGYLLSHQGYFLHGRDLMQRLDFLPSRGDDPGPWISRLRQKGIRLVAVGPVLEGWHKELKWHYTRELPWILDPQGPFTPVFGDDPREETVIYRLE